MRLALILLFLCTLGQAFRSVLLPPGQQWFSIGVLPDTQYYTAYHRDIFEEQTFWLCQCQEDLSLIFVSQLGDIVDHADSTSEWNAARNAFSFLTDCDLPFLTLPGNHDTVSNGTALNYNSYDTYFNNWTLSYDGSYPPNTAHNTYSLFVVWNPEGWQEHFMFLSLEYMPSAETLAWAGEVLTNYSSYTAILSTHYALSDCPGSTILPSIQSLLSSHCNILFVVSGHAFYCGGENEAWVATGGGCANKRQWVFVSDFQGDDNGGDGWLRIYTFEYSSVDTFTVCAHSYSPVTNQIDPDSFSVSFPSGLNGTGCAGFNPCLSNYERPGVLLSWIGGFIGVVLMFLLHAAI